ncbi:MAG: ATPase, partial [Ruminococcus sp.]|nr:ATPase [Ruminococcus sp.]
MSEIIISYNEVADLPENTYTLIDVRSEVSFGFGTIPSAVNVPDIISEAKREKLPKDKKLVLFCMRGNQSIELAEELREMGFDAYSLKDGYGSWLRKYCDREDKAREIEISITKKRRFKEKIFNRFTKAIVKYELVKPNDKIAVCISGGKDSMLMAKLFQELKRHNKFPFELVFLVMDPGYNELNRLVIENNAAALGVPITVFETSIFDAVYNVEKNPCY